MEQLHIKKAPGRANKIGNGLNYNGVVWHCIESNYL